MADPSFSRPDVRGVLILSRPTGIVLASSGQLFAPPPTPLPPTTARLGSSESTPLSSQDTVKPPVNGVDGGETVEVGVSVSEVARRYAASAVKMVEAVGEEVRTIGEEGVSSVHHRYTGTSCLRLMNSILLACQDDLRLLRIRTRRHELIITPGKHYSFCTLLCSLLRTHYVFSRLPR